MKLYLNNTQRKVLLEMLGASEVNALNGKDGELANAFNTLSQQIKPLNATYVNLKRPEAETIVEFCDIVRTSLENALTFIETKSEQPEEAKEAQKLECNQYLTEITAIITQLQDKIRANP